jgi:hypothetical protein
MDMKYCFQKFGPLIHKIEAASRDFFQSQGTGAACEQAIRLHEGGNNY